MFSSPDLPTLRLCSFLASAAYALIFAALWVRRRHEIYLLHWGASAAAYGLALVLLELGFGLPPILRSGFGYGLVAVSDLLILSGIRRFDEKRPFVPWMAAPIAATIVGVVVPRLIGGEQPGAAAFSHLLGSVALAICVGICAVAIWMDRPDDGALPRRIVAVALFAYVPGFLVSIGMQLWAPLRDSALSLLPMMQDQVLLAVYNLGLLATPWEKALRQLRESVLRDALTGAWNRVALKQQESAFASSSTSLFLIDIDHFKSINDTYGHAAGTRCWSPFPAASRRWRHGGAACSCGWAATSS